jgi:hypothetical protein
MRWIWSILPLFLIVLVGCGGAGGGGTPTLLTFQSEFAEYPVYTVNGFDYFFGQAAAGREVRVLPDAPGAHDVVFDGQTYAVGEWIPVSLSLEKNESREMLFRNPSGSVIRRATIWSLPTDFPILNVSTNNPTPGEVLLAVNRSGSSNSASFLIILDEAGSPTFYRRGARMMNFDRFEIGGSLYYTFIEETSGDAVVLDENFLEFDRVRLQPFNGSTWTEVDVHDFRMLAPGHYVLPAYVPKIVNNDPARPGQNVPVIAAVFQEVLNGSVVMHWDSTDHPELYALSKTPNSQDYVHLNSVEIDPNDGHFITSNRHLDNVMKIHRTTGEILWILGGLGDQFGLLPEQMPSRNHDARISADGFLTLFDNGNASSRSRALRMSLDEVNMSVLGFEEYDLDDHFSVAMGSTQFLDPGTVLVGWGLRRPNESDVTEWEVGSGIKRFELWLNANDGTGRSLSYRARKYPAPPRPGRAKAP